MKSLGAILKSAARTEILRALFYQHEAVSLRQLARLAGVHPHSAELALNELAREKLVKRRKSSTRCFYWKERNHPDWLVIEGVCHGAEQAHRLAQLPALSRRARSILPFIEEAGAMLFKARKATRVT